MANFEDQEKEVGLIEAFIWEVVKMQNKVSLEKVEVVVSKNKEEEKEETRQTRRAGTGS